MEVPVRINKYLSDAGVCSRRDVDDLILSGRVEVNGELARIGMQLVASRDKVTIDGVVVDPSHPERNAIDPDYVHEEEKAPWWELRRQKREAEEERLLSNPKSKLLRKGRKQAPRRESAKGLVKKKSNNAGKNSVLKQEGTLTRKGLFNAKELEAQNKEKAEKRAMKQKGRTFGEALSDKHKLMNVKTRKIDQPFNPKSASLRGKRTSNVRRKRR